MSIVRVGIIVAVVVAVLPADKQQQARLYDRAASAVHWTATFCDRNGPTCSQAGELWSAFVQKAQFGAQMAYELAQKYSSSQSGSVTPASTGSVHGTLTPQDLQPAWRGGANGHGRLTAGLRSLHYRGSIAQNVLGMPEAHARGMVAHGPVGALCVSVASSQTLKIGSGLAKLSDIRSDFAVLDDWEDRYRYVIELGRTLKPLPEELRTDANKVRGCASQVWLATHVERAGNGAAPRLEFQADSDAHIVRGLIAILFAIYDGRPADEILGTDADAIFAELGLKEHLTPAALQRPRLDGGPHPRRRCSGSGPARRRSVAEATQSAGSSNSGR